MPRFDAPVIHDAAQLNSYNIAQLQYALAESFSSDPYAALIEPNIGHDNLRQFASSPIYIYHDLTLNMHLSPEAAARAAAKEAERQPLPPHEAKEWVSAKETEDGKFLADITGTEFEHALFILRKHDGDIEKAVESILSGASAPVEMEQGRGRTREELEWIANIKQDFAFMFPTPPNHTDDSGGGRGRGQSADRVIDLTGEDSPPAADTRFRATTRSPDPAWQTVRSNAPADVVKSEDDQLKEIMQASLHHFAAEELDTVPDNEVVLREDERCRSISSSATWGDPESSILRGTKRALSPTDWGARPTKIRSIDQNNWEGDSSGNASPSEEKDPLDQSKVSLPSIFTTFEDTYRVERPARLPELDSRIRRAPTSYLAASFPSVFPSTNEKYGRPTLSHSNFDDADYGQSARPPRSNFDMAPILSYPTLDTAANRRALSAPSMKSEWASPASDIQQSPVTLTPSRGKLPKEITDFLQAWFHRHSDHPYPSEEEKKRLCHATGLSMSQVSNWMINARRRLPAASGPITDLLNGKLRRHSNHPYASEQETKRLGHATDLSTSQVSSAFSPAATPFQGSGQAYRRLLSSPPPVGVRKKDEANSSGEEPFMASASRYALPQPQNFRLPSLKDLNFQYRSRPPPQDTLPPPQDFRLPSLEDLNFQYRSRPSPQDDNHQDNIADSSGEETAGESEDVPWFAVPEEGNWGARPASATSDAHDALTADSALHRQDERDVMSDQLYDIFAVIERLDKFFHLEKASYAKFLACRGASAQQLLDFLQDLLDYDVDVTTINRRRLFKALIRLSGDSKLYPRCLTLTGLQQERLVAGGSFGDVYKGLLGDQIVAIKMMRVFKESDIDALLKVWTKVSLEFGREALIWRQLSHPNLLPFFGLYYFQQRLCLVSPWMENGHIRVFLKKKLYDTDYLLCLILDVALGLEHLHDTGVVHSDLKGDNIFVTPSGRACIADFGLSSIITSVSSIQFTHSSKPTQGGTTRYQALELLRGGHNDTLSDIYAFAGVAYEILTGTPPFPDLRTDGAVVTAVLGGCRPPQPDSCSGTPSLDGLWKLLQDCWEEQPAMRPTAAQIVQRLMSPDIQATKMQSAPDWDELSTSRFRGYLASPRPLPSFSKFERIIFGDAISDGSEQPAGSLIPPPRQLFAAMVSVWFSARFHPPLPPSSVPAARTDIIFRSFLYLDDYAAAIVVLRTTVELGLRITVRTYFTLLRYMTVQPVFAFELMGPFEPREIADDDNAASEWIMGRLLEHNSREAVRGRDGSGARVSTEPRRRVPSVAEIFEQDGNLTKMRDPIDVFPLISTLRRALQIRASSTEVPWGDAWRKRTVTKARYEMVPKGIPLWSWLPAAKGKMKQYQKK
ncbi:hypothetical protein B0H16DRAFT_1484510 [Mycena metata]|uniref:non-specific serine/threonine protein kinase n=1 Tax=Mycena metata TaxID=1033252 RepID=A0AAD7GJW8_9AGAR|nr:hypothetical protein B0H16DRAFT_1484510 [Mycena metata]